MDYEKKYKEALERAKILYNDKNEIGYANAESVLEEVFPLLKESEDERIRKEIINYFAKGKEYLSLCSIGKDDILAWLEKQGEQKPTIEMKSAEESLGIDSETYNKIVDECIYGEQNPADKEEPKFKVGDWVVSPNGVYWHIDAIQNGRYEVTADTGQCGNWPLDTNIYRLWTIQDAKDGNVLTNGDFPCIFKRCDGNGSLYVYCGINAHNDFSILSEDPENVWDDYSKQYFPATKEQRDLLFQKMKEAGYEWDAEKKELKKIEDEEYNGEDYGIDSLWHAKNILEETLGKVDGYQTDDGILEHKCAIAAVNKLYKQKPKRMISAEAKEALYDKPDWSEKDKKEYKYVLKFVDNVLNNCGNKKDYEHCKRCYDWLKSLKERIGG